MMEVTSRGAKELTAKVLEEYKKGLDDYHMAPVVSGMGKRIDDGDTVVFGCRRGEREIELTEMFTEPGFDKVPIRKLKNLEFVILTQYHEKFSSLPIAFGPEHVEMPLAQVLSENNRTQFHLAESEKFAHVTFFFNGGENKPFKGESDCCVPSLKGIPFETRPELSLPGIYSKLSEELGKHDFIVVNFANGDVIGHTSDSDAKIKACAEVDKYLEKSVTDALDKDYVVLVAADHGNIETLLGPTGHPHVAHTTNRVKFFVMDKSTSAKEISLKDGALSDVAPTILDIMGINKPEIMTGSSLLTSSPFEGNRKVLLLILDGWGTGNGDDNDAIHLASTPYWDKITSNESFSNLEASGPYVGLGKGKPGNSEAGHINLGAGRCVAQDDIRIDRALQSGEFAKNSVLLKAVKRAKDSCKALHVLTYLTYKSSHGTMEYALEVCRMAKEIGQEEVYLHIIFDGRSTEPGSAPALLGELEAKLNEIGIGQIVDGIGRGLVLDRDGNYENVKKAYDMMVRP